MANKKVVLHTATTDNSGKRREAGEEIVIGDGEEQIMDRMVTDLVNRGMAAMVAKAKAAAKSD